MHCAVPKDRELLTVQKTTVTQSAPVSPAQTTRHMKARKPKSPAHSARRRIRDDSSVQHSPLTAPSSKRRKKSNTQSTAHPTIDALKLTAAHSHSHSHSHSNTHSNSHQMAPSAVKPMTVLKSNTNLPVHGAVGMGVGVGMNEDLDIDEESSSEVS